MAKFNPSLFVAPKAKPLPVILLIDTSGSMGEIIDTTGMVYTGEKVFVDGKTYSKVTGGISRIQVLNSSCREMISDFADNVKNEVEIEVAIITFGVKVSEALPLTPAGEVCWTDLVSDGDTPLGGALELAKKMIEDKNVIPSRAYRPVVILISDGRPDAGWEAPFERFISEGRTSKCDRMAMGIGDDADKNILAKFIAGTGHPLFTATDSNRIKEFFNYVTMSVTVRSRSVNPNIAPSSDELNSEHSSNSSDEDEDSFF